MTKATQSSWLDPVPDRAPAPSSAVVAPETQGESVRGVAPVIASVAPVESQPTIAESLAYFFSRGR